MELTVKPPFDGSRLELARSFRGWTQSELARRVFASAGTVSLYERSRIKSNPPDHLVKAFGEVMGFKPDFFFGALEDAFDEKECNFRHRRSTPEAAKKRARAHGTLLGMVISKLKRDVRFPSYNVPEIPGRSTQEIELAAEECRRFWKLGLDTPIVHIGRVLEHAGVILFQHFSASEKVDAFSRRGGTSVIFLNLGKYSASRWIFDIAHETGHLVLHSGGLRGSDEVESEADRFASAFLLPRRAFGAEFSARPLSWDHVFALKRRWRTSAAAIIRRAYDLSLIGAVTYRSLYKARSAKGWIYNEPCEPDFVFPELLQSAFKGISTSRLREVAESLNMPPATFEEITGCRFPAAKRSEIVQLDRFKERRPGRASLQRVVEAPKVEPITERTRKNGKE